MRDRMEDNILVKLFCKMFIDVSIDVFVIVEGMIIC